MKIIKKLTKEMKKVVAIILLTVMFLNYLPATVAGIGVNGTITAGTNLREINDILEGRFDTNEEGATTYQIAIEVPQGTNGVQPNLSLVYNSKLGEGLCGIGWSLNGLSAILRVGPNYKSGITNSSKDKFILDGQKLICVSGAYGASNSEYRTETETWSKIISEGTSGTGPSSFTIKTKEGFIWEYGKGNTTDNTKISASDGTINTWLLNKVTDRNGNSMKYIYGNNGKNQYYPTSIEYTSNNNTGLVSRRKVTFVYEDRKDKLTSYTSGVKVEITKRLTGIKTYCEQGNTINFIDIEDLVKDYVITYDNSSATKKSRIIKVTAKDKNGIEAEPITFTYQEGDNSRFLNDKIFGTRTEKLESEGKNSQWFVDLDDDGFTDLLYLKDDKKTYRKLLNDGTELVRDSTWGVITRDIANEGANAQWVLDLNGDGLPDLLYLCKDKETDGYKYRALINNKHVVSECEWGTRTEELTDNNYNAQWVLDLNGDGLPDLLYSTGDEETNNVTYRSLINTGTKFGIDTALVNRVDRVGLTNGQWLLDMNGDGLPDIVYVAYDWDKSTNDKKIYYVYINNGNGFNDEIKWGERTYYTEWDGENSHWFEDMNCDSLPDLIYLQKGSNTYRVLINNGNGFNEDKEWGTREKKVSWEGKNSQWIIDMNGDGLPDLMYLEKDTQNYHVLINYGNGFIKDSLGKTIDTVWGTGSNHVKGDGKNAQWVMDFTGDGLSDLMYLDSDGKKYHVLINNGTGFDKEKGITKDTVWAERDNEDLAYDRENSQWLLDINEDGLLDYVYLENNTKNYHVFKHKSYYPDLLKKITSLGSEIEINYKLLTDPSVYTKETNTTTYPIININNPGFYVVSGYKVSSKINSTTGTNNISNFEFKYSGAKIDERIINGDGFLGFRTRTVQEVDARRDTVYTYSQTAPFTGMTEKIEVKTKDGQMIDKNEYEYINIFSSQSAQNLPMQKSEVKTKYINGTEAFSSKTENEYDDYGNIIKIKDYGQWDKTNNRDADITDNVYTYLSYKNDTTNWYIGFVTNKLLSKNGSKNINWTNNTWDNSNDLYWEQTEYYPLTQPTGKMSVKIQKNYDNVNNEWVSTQYSYDEYGNMIRETSDIYTNTPTTSVTNYNYDTTYHTFLTKTTTPINALGKNLIKETDIDPRFGIVKNEYETRYNSDIKTITKQNTIDDFGNIKEIKIPDPEGKLTVVETEYIYQDLDTKKIFTENRTRPSWTESNTSNWLWTQEYEDGFGRTYKILSKGPNGKIICKDSVFNNIGLLEKESSPYYQGDTTNWTEYTYDETDQIKTITQPNGMIVNMEKTIGSINKNGVNIPVIIGSQINDYNGIKSTTKIYVDAKGNKLKMEDPDGGVVSYEYNLLGKPTKITDQDGVINTVTYYSLGDNLTNENGDTGKTIFTYRKGILVSKTDAKGQIEKYKYDLLGRIINENVGSINKKYTYDEGGRFDRGDLYTVEKTITISPTLIIQASKYEYKSGNYGTTKGLKSTFEGTSYATEAKYGPAGQILTELYPDNSLLTYNYNDDMSLHKLSMQEWVKNTSTNGWEYSAPVDHITYNDYTAQDKPKEIIYANGVRTNYTYDALGRLNTHQVQNSKSTLVNNTFGWDNLNRLSSITDNRISPVKNETQCFNYTKSGKLISAVSNGTYGTLNYKYQGTNYVTGTNYTDPANYAGTNLTFKEGQIFQILPATHKLTGAGYVYDANGNMTQNKTSSYIYDEENYLINVSTGSGYIVEYKYDNSGRKYKAAKYGNLENITVYLSDQYEIIDREKLQNGVKVRERIHSKYIKGLDGRLVNIVKPDSEVDMRTALDTFGAIGGITFLDKIKNKFKELTNNYSETANAQNTFKFFMMICMLGFLFLLITNYKNRKTWRAYTSAGVLFFVTVFTICTPPLNAELTMKAGIVGSVNPAGNISSGTYYMHTNHIGSTSVVTDKNGNETYRTVYKPFGEVYGTISATQDFLPSFTGKDLDLDTNLYYFNARWYDPSIGRFITPDNGLGADENVPGAYNRYSYCVNNPINYVDPSGNFGILVSMLIGVIVSVAISGAMYGLEAAITGNWSWKQFGIELAIGAITGLIGGGIAGAATKIAAKETVKQLAKTVVSKVGCRSAMTLRVIGMAVEESAENVGGQLIANAINKDPWDTGLAEAAISGALMGGIGGSATAQRLCFAAGTLVVTEDGTKPIEQMKKGDKVWSYNEKTGKEEINTVLDAFLSGYTDKIVEIKAGGELIEATEDHPFYIDNGWVKAKDLKEGTILITKDGMKIKIDSVKVVKKGVNIPVYNITVDIVHTYYITNSKILVHNVLWYACSKLYNGNGQELSIGYNQAARKALGRQDNVYIYRRYIGKFINRKEYKQLDCGSSYPPGFCAEPEALYNLINGIFTSPSNFPELKRAYFITVGTDSFENLNKKNFPKQMKACITCNVYLMGGQKNTKAYLKPEITDTINKYRIDRLTAVSQQSTTTTTQITNSDGWTKVGKGKRR
jgi:RHS repeat-associated protein